MGFLQNSIGEQVNQIFHSFQSALAEGKRCAFKRSKSATMSSDDFFFSGNHSVHDIEVYELLSFNAIFL